MIGGKINVRKQKKKIISIIVLIILSLKINISYCADIDKGIIEEQQETMGISSFIENYNVMHLIQLRLSTEIHS